jgi:hypothetical protein
MTEVNKSNPLEKSKVMHFVSRAFDTYLEKKIKGTSEYSFSVSGVRDWIKEADDIKKHIEDNLK